MGNTCKPMAVSFQCMTKSTTKKKKSRKLQGEIQKKKKPYTQSPFFLIWNTLEKKKKELVDEEKNKISNLTSSPIFSYFQKKSCPHLFFILILQILDTDQANQEKPDSSNLGNWSWASASPTLVVWFWIKLAKPLICKMRMKIVPPHRDIRRTEWNKACMCLAEVLVPRRTLSKYNWSYFNVLK